MTNEIQKREPAPVTEVSPSAIIAQMAADPKCDADKLQKLLDIRDQWEAGEARKAFAKAISEFAASCPPVPKLDLNDGKAYAKMERIMKVVNPEAVKHGLTIVWTSFTQSGDMGHIKGILMHRDGHTVDIERDIPIPKIPGGANEAQKSGAAQTYCERYATCGALPVQIVKDTDGAYETVVTAEQAKQLSTAAAAVNHEKQTLAFGMVERWEDFPARLFDVAMAGLEKRAAK